MRCGRTPPPSLPRRRAPRRGCAGDRALSIRSRATFRLRAASASASGRGARRASPSWRRRRGRSARPCERSDPSRAPRSIAVIRNSAVWIESKSLTSAFSSLRNDARSRIGLGGQSAGAQDLEPRTVAGRGFVAGGQAAALELRREQPVRGLGNAAGTLANARAQLPESSRQFFGLLLFGERIAAGDELLLDSFERRRDAVLRLVTVDLRRIRGRCRGVLCRRHAPRAQEQTHERHTNPDRDPASPGTHGPYSR